jgi:hypothetical protein
LIAAATNDDGALPGSRTRVPFTSISIICVSGAVASGLGATAGPANSTGANAIPGVGADTGPVASASGLSP